MGRPRLVTVALLCAALLAVPACGDDETHSSSLSCTDREDDQVIAQGPDEPRHRMPEADLVSAELEITDTELTATWNMALDVDPAIGGSYDLLLRGDDRFSWFWFRASLAEPSPSLTLHGPAAWSHSDRDRAGLTLSATPIVEGKSVTAAFPLDALSDRGSLTLWMAAAHVPHPGIGVVIDSCPDSLIGGQGSGGAADWLPIRLA